jgi:DNA recombination protein RmuC
MRGGMGEVRLEMLLEQMLAPGQYETNVKTKKGSSDQVEFAIRLPGKNDDDSVVYLPIDAKFPQDQYHHLQEAYDQGEPDVIEAATHNLEVTIKKMAKDIRDKYLDPPNTTDFGIMFLPFEGIYAEVVRRSALVETLQRDFRVIITGPTTLAAMLNSLQMGFKTLAIQKRSSEVWQVLGAVKTEFDKFGGLLDKTQKNLHIATTQLDELVGKRTNAIRRKLKSVESLPASETAAYLPELTEPDVADEDES